MSFYFIVAIQQKEEEEVEKKLEEEEMQNLLASQINMIALAYTKRKQTHSTIKFI